jgi:hypothetical protein
MCWSIPIPETYGRAWRRGRRPSPNLNSGRLRMPAVGRRFPRVGRGSPRVGRGSPDPRRIARPQVSRIRVVHYSGGHNQLLQLVRIHRLLKLDEIQLARSRHLEERVDPAVDQPLVEVVRDGPDSRETAGRLVAKKKVLQFRLGEAVRASSTRSECVETTTRCVSRERKRVSTQRMCINSL